MARKKVIITCAITGSVHTPNMSRYLPITPDRIARDPKKARPTADPDVFTLSLKGGDWVAF